MGPSGPLSPPPSARGVLVAPGTGPPDWRFAVLREKSCGIVPFREENGEILYLVISSAVTKREHWEFPKGGVEEGERELDTALRELWEETGVRDVQVLSGYREPIRYIYRRPEGLVSKQVVYFIARVGDPTVKLRLEEAKDYRWANYDESRKLLRHSNARALLDRCHAFITGKPLPQRRPGQQRGDEAERRDGPRRPRRAGGRGRRPEGGARRGQAPAAPAEKAAVSVATPKPAATPGPAPVAAAGAQEAGEAQRRRKRRRRRRRRSGNGQQRPGAPREGQPAAGPSPASGRETP